MNFISGIAWVPRGRAKALPDEIRLKPDELKEIFELHENDHDDPEDLAKLSDEDSEEEEDTEEDEWATDDEEEGTDNEKVVENDEVADEGEDGVPEKGGFSVSTLAVYSSNNEDPYVTVKDDEDIDSEDDDFRIRSDDNLLAVAHVDQDANMLEIYVYNEKDDDLYVHHDMMLPSYPLALEWLSYAGEEKGNYVAVGSMKTSIQIWDIDVVNAMEPTCELKSKSKKRKRDKPEDSGLVGHTDAVLALAWNQDIEQVFASGSADQTVVLWDLDQGKPASVLTGFSDKVQAMKWRPDFPKQILCGSCDKTVRLFDCRYIQAKHKMWNVDGEVERLAWSNTDKNYFYVATESGQLYTFDVRNRDAAVSMVEAHGKTITGLSLSSVIPGLLVTTSEDKRIKVWDLNNSSQLHIPELVCERKLKMGELQFACMSPDSPMVVALAGEESDSNFRILRLDKISSEVQKRFGDRIPDNHRTKEEEEKPQAPVQSLFVAAPVEKSTRKTAPEVAKARRPKRKKERQNREVLQSAPAPPVASEPKPPRFRPKNKYGKRQGLPPHMKFSKPQPVTSGSRETFSGNPERPAEHHQRTTVKKDKSGSLPVKK